MIARTWKGWTSPAKAEDYRRHYEAEVSQHLHAVPGFRGARLLQRDEEGGVAFTSITFFDSLGAVRAFAGENYERAVVAEEARRALIRWDEQVTHHEVAVDLF
jgi:heme-degrading monooxygenase HmoA